MAARAGSGRRGRKTPSLTVFGAFLGVASAIAALASATLFWPHGALPRVWSGKEASYHQLLQLGTVAGVGFAALAAALAAACVGWIRRRPWAWWIAAVALTTNLVADLATAVVTRRWANALGAIVEGLILLWVVSPAVRGVFGGGRRDRSTRPAPQGTR